MSELDFWNLMFTFAMAATSVLTLGAWRKHGKRWMNSVSWASLVLAIVSVTFAALRQ